MEDSYPFTLWSGLITPEHRSRMGTAIWVFLWLVDKTTREQDGRGIVLGGKAVSCEEIAAQLGISDKAVWRALRKLKRCGYIEAERRTSGLTLTVLRSKKWRRPERRTGWKGTDENVRSRDTESDNKFRSDRTEVSDHLDKNGRSQAHMTCTVDSAEDKAEPRAFRASEKVLRKIDSLPEADRHRLEAEAMRQMAAKPFTRSMLVRESDGYRLSNSPVAVTMFRLALVKAYEEGLRVES